MVSCVDATTDVNNCGTCGRVCSAGPNATATCALGACGLRCNAGFADCDMNPANGCEVDTRTSAMNCGACNTVCRAAPNAMAPACVAGACALTCNAGFANCDMNAANGCEVNTNTSAVHCGMCGRACAAGATCMAGTCVGGTGALYNPFDTAANFPTGWSRVGVGGGAVMSALSATCARTGAMGLEPASDLVWKNTPVVGAAGTRASVWMRAVASGRAYLVFGISGTTGFALTAGPNTNSIIWQRIDSITTSPSYTDRASTAYTFTAGQWYRLEVVFDGTSTVRGNLYGADGTTVLWTGTHALPSAVNGGVGLRSFNGLCLDELDGVAR